MNSGVCPMLLLLFTSAPFSMSNRTIPISLRAHAMCSDVQKVYLFARLASAPLLMRNLATGRCQFVQASNNAENPLISALFISAPFSASNSAISRWPFSHAEHNGVIYIAFLPLMSAPLSISSLATAVNPDWHAMCSSCSPQINGILLTSPIKSICSGTSSFLSLLLTSPIKSICFRTSSISPF